MRPVKSASRWLSLPLLGTFLGLALVWAAPGFLPQATRASLVLQFAPTDPAKPLSQDELGAEARNLAAEPAVAGLKITPDVKGQRISLELASDDAGLAAGILTRLAQAYAARTQADVPEFLSMGRELAQRQRALIEAESRLAALTSERNDIESSGKFDDLKQELQAAEAKADEARAQAAAVRRAMDAGTLAASSLRQLKTPAMQALREEREGLLADIESATAASGSEDPGVLDLRFALKNLDRKISNEADRIAGSLETEARTAGKRAGDIKARLGTASRSQEIEDQQAELLRAISSQRGEVEQLLQRFSAHQAAGQARFGVSLAGPVSLQAIAPQSSPLLLALGALFGAGLGGFMAARLRKKPKPAAAHSAADHADDEDDADDADDADDEAHAAVSAPARSSDWRESFAAAARLLADAAPMPAAAVAAPAPQPAYVAWPQEEAIAQPVLPVAAPANDLPLRRGEVLNSELRRVGTWALGLVDDPGLAVLGVAGIDPQSGDSAALAADLARGLAMHLPRVMLLDASPEPQHLDICLPPATRSLADFLSGRASLSEIIARDADTGLHWIAGVKGGAGARMEAILQALTAAYDLVVVHAGPYRMAEPRALMACNAVAVTAPMLQALEAREVMDGLRQAGIAHAEFAASSGAGAARAGRAA